MNPTEFFAKVIPSLHLKSFSNGQYEFQFRINSLKKSINDSTVPISGIVSKVLSTNYNKLSTIASVRSDDKNVIFHLDQSAFFQSVLGNATENPIDYRLIDEPAENIIVEYRYDSLFHIILFNDIYFLNCFFFGGVSKYSSPNIAKPFHIGHLRSTIIGNFIANVLSTYGHNVTRINYLGDWGTQFGYLKLGMEMSGLADDEIAKDPIRHLYNAYVQANRKAESEPDFANEARAAFSQMENGNLPDLDAWHQYRRYTVNEMANVYGRLGVKFDNYAWESDYRKVNILTHLECMRMSGFLQVESDGKESFVLDETTRPPILKSDGSTLYLTRDIAAVVDRQEKYRFDRMYYVAGNEQHQHFDHLFRIARKMSVKNADKLYHVKFGRVEKMSTRKGNAVFLNDILDEMRDLMHSKQIQSPSNFLLLQTKIKRVRMILLNSFFFSISDTKVDLASDEKRTADMEGVSAIIAYELQRMPTASYEFNMDNIVNV